MVGSVLRTVMKSEVWRGLRPNSLLALLELILMTIKFSTPEYNRCFIKCLCAALDSAKSTTHSAPIVIKLFEIFTTIDFEITEEEWIHLSA